LFGVLSRDVLKNFLVKLMVCEALTRHKYSIINHFVTENIPLWLTFLIEYTAPKWNGWQALGRAVVCLCPAHRRGKKEKKTFLGMPHPF